MENIIIIIGFVLFTSTFITFCMHKQDKVKKENEK
jgi:hypothetical protein